MDVQVGACQSGLPLLPLLILLRKGDGVLDETVQAGDAESQWKATQVTGFFVYPSTIIFYYLVRTCSREVT